MENADIIHILRDLSRDCFVKVRKLSQLEIDRATNRFSNKQYEATENVGENIETSNSKNVLTLQNDNSTVQHSKISMEVSQIQPKKISVPRLNEEISFPIKRKIKKSEDSFERKRHKNNLGKLEEMPNGLAVAINSRLNDFNHSSGYIKSLEIFKKPKKSPFNSNLLFNYLTGELYNSYFGAGTTNKNSSVSLEKIPATKSSDLNSGNKTTKSTVRPKLKSNKSNPIKKSPISKKPHKRCSNKSEQSLKIKKKKPLSNKKAKLISNNLAPKNDPNYLKRSKSRQLNLNIPNTTDITKKTVMNNQIGSWSNKTTHSNLQTNSEQLNDTNYFGNCFSTPHQSNLSKFTNGITNSNLNLTQINTNKINNNCNPINLQMNINHINYPGHSESVIPSSNPLSYSGFNQNAIAYPQKNMNEIYRQYVGILPNNHQINNNHLSHLSNVENISLSYNQPISQYLQDSTRAAFTANVNTNQSVVDSTNSAKLMYNMKDSRLETLFSSLKSQSLSFSSDKAEHSLVNFNQYFSEPPMLHNLIRPPNSATHDQNIALHSNSSIWCSSPKKKNNLESTVDHNNLISKVIEELMETDDLVNKNDLIANLFQFLSDQNNKTIANGSTTVFNNVPSGIYYNNPLSNKDSSGINPHSFDIVNEGQTFGGSRGNVDINSLNFQIEDLRKLNQSLGDINSESLPDVYQNILAKAKPSSNKIEDISNVPKFIDLDEEGRLISKVKRSVGRPRRNCCYKHCKNVLISGISMCKEHFVSRMNEFIANDIRKSSS